MTTMHHDDAAPTTAVEDALTRLDAAARTPPPARRLSAVAAPATRADPASGSEREHRRSGDPVGRSAARTSARTTRGGHEGGPRLRLVPTPIPVRTTPANPLAAPPLASERVRRLVAVDSTLGIEDDDERGAPPATDAGRFAHGVGLACVEVVLGRRPAAQLVRWVAPDVLEALHERADLVRRAGVLSHARRPAARRVRVCAVDAYTAEVCLVVDDGVRVRAVAMRVVAHRGAWRVTTLEIG